MATAFHWCWKTKDCTGLDTLKEWEKRRRWRELWTPRFREERLWEDQESDRCMCSKRSGEKWTESWKKLHKLWTVTDGGPSCRPHASTTQREAKSKQVSRSRRQKVMNLFFKKAKSQPMRNERTLKSHRMPPLKFTMCSDNTVCELPHCYHMFIYD